MNPPLLQGEALKQATRKLAAELQAKIEGIQNGVGTFSDHALVELIAHLEQLEQAPAWEDSVAQLNSGIEDLKLGLQRIQLYLSRRRQGRLVDFQERTQLAPGGVHGNCDIHHFDLIMSQGVFDCLQWKGMPLFKTVFDFSIYPMLLWELKPKTIIELGSGTGASAVWLADLARLFGIGSKVYSVDLKKPEANHEEITFIEGDCRTIDRALDEGLLRHIAHPWMIVEDAHVNVHGVLNYLHSYLIQGDYVIVEDSAGKVNDIREFLSNTPACYKVDTYYTDFFGRNVTSAQDSIFIRT
jgi:cephalosporin hydroxylase